MTDNIIAWCGRLGTEWRRKDNRSPADMTTPTEYAPVRSFIAGPGELTGPVYVNGVPYVPATELKRLRTALEWYGEQAEASARHTIVINPKALEAIVTSLSLDAGGRARAALGPEPKT
jgi:hypothetical protein